MEKTERAAINFIVRVYRAGPAAESTRGARCSGSPGRGLLFSCWPSLRRCWSRAFLSFRTMVWCDGTRECSAQFDTDALAYRPLGNLPRRQDIVGGGVDDTSGTVEIRLPGTRCFNL